MKQREKIKQMLDNEPYLRQRKNRYVVCARLTGVDADTCKLICSIADEYRHQTQGDELGYQLEKEWHASPALKGEEQRLFKLRSITQ